MLPRDKLEEDKEFDVVGDLSELQAKPLEEQPTNQNGSTTSHQEGEGFNLHSQILKLLWSSLSDGHFHCCTCINWNYLIQIIANLPLIYRFLKLYFYPLGVWADLKCMYIYVIYFAEEDDLMIVDEIEVIKSGTKRKADQEPDEINAKRPKSSGDHNDDIVIL